MDLHARFMEFYNLNSYGMVPWMFLDKLFGYKQGDIAHVDPWINYTRDDSGAVVKTAHLTEFKGCDNPNVEVVDMYCTVLEHPEEIIPLLRARFPKLKHLIVDVKCAYEETSAKPLSELLYEGLGLHTLWMTAGRTDVQHWFLPPSKNVFGTGDGFIVVHDKNHAFELTSGTRCVFRCPINRQLSAMVKARWNAAGLIKT